MPSGALRQEDVIQLLTNPPDGRPLPLIYLLDDEVNATMRVTAFLLKYRAGGFMVVVPDTPAVRALVGGLAEEGVENPFGFSEADIACETPRRRAVGAVSVLLVDVPWAGLDLFRRGASLRSSPLSLVSITLQGTVVRPVVAAALAAADNWINRAIAEPELQESMGEYATAAEEQDNPDEEADAEDEAGALPEPDQELARLRAQVAALERAAQAAPPATGVGRTSAPHGRRGARDLFPEAASVGLSGRDLERLREAAGAPPPRIAQHERAPQRETAVQQADDLLAELDLEATQDEPGAGTSDPILHRLLLIQTRMLNQLTASRPQGALESALASGGAKDDGNLNARGSAARDAYVRLLKDSVQVSSQIRRLVAEDLGESVEDPPSSLMRRYIERRCPVGEHRTLALIGSFAGHAWQRARETDNVEMEAWFARLVLFVDQAGTENGRTQLAWLLAGLPEPSWSTMMRRKSGLKPFAKSCPSLWASANLAYLREMDWLSSKMASSSSGDPSKDSGKDDAAAEEGDPPTRPPRRPRRPKGAADS